VLLTPSQTRVFSAIAKILLVLSLLTVGRQFFLPAAHGFHILYWTGSVLLTVAICFGGVLRRAISQWHFQTRVRGSLPGSGADLDRLTAAATTLRDGHEERALYILQNMTFKMPDTAVYRARDWLQALASVRWMARQKPGRALSGLYQRYPQIHALIFSADPSNIHARHDALARELSSVTAGDLDALAREYMLLVDVLIEGLDQNRAPFGDEAEHLLAFATGKTFTLNVHQRFVSWWNGMRPVLRRGGGALLLGLRLMQREAYAEAAALLSRLEEGGMLSPEADTVRRASAFLSLFARPLWRMTGADIPRYFKDGCYYLAGEMGVLRFPTAELPEVARCCQHGEYYHARKRRLVEDSLDLWQATGDEVAGPLGLLMKRLLEHKGQRCSMRLNFWREAWNACRDRFEETTKILMRGVAATSGGDLKLAERLFARAAQLDPHSSVPLVNQVQIYNASNRESQAEVLANEIVRRFPKDGSMLVALGRLALQKNDTARAEKFLINALDHLEPPTEALIWLGEVKLAEGLYLESQHYYDYAKQLDDQLPEPKFGLARIYMETQRFDLAIENLNSIVVQGPDAARDLAHYMLYRAYRQKNEDVRAFECLDKIPAHFFKEPDLLDDIAIHLEGEKRYNKAREFAERAMILRAGIRPDSEDSDAMTAI
jgi:tetratricopeptide (TPR) repeat protein